MSISLAGINAQNYIGTIYAVAMQIAGKSGRAVPLSFNWLAYGAGSANQNIVVAVNLGSGRSTQPAPLFDMIRSIYIDNLGSAVPLFVQFDDTGFTVTAQPYSDGWYPVFTNGFAFHIAAFGFTDTNVSQAKMYVSNVPVVAFTDVSLQSVLNQSLSSPSIGGGSGVGSIAVIIPGQDYNNGNLTVSGAGVTGCTAHGLLDQWGRFTQVIVDTPGTGALGAVTVTPTGGQTIPPNFDPVNGVYVGGAKVVYNGTEWQWNVGSNTIVVGAGPWNSTAFYNTNNQVNFGGNIYLALTNSVGRQPNINPAEWGLLGSAVPTGLGWTNSGTPPGTKATFSSTLTANSSSIITSGFAPEALGDQATNLINTITGVGVFEDNLFGTPFASGFIYVTHIYVNVTSFGAGNIWSFENALGYAPLTFKPGQVGPQLEFQKMNMKLDATIDWQLKCTAFANSISVSHGFVWTYSQQ
jgi:hypothetical protein